ATQVQPRWGTSVLRKCRRIGDQPSVVCQISGTLKLGHDEPRAPRSRHPNAGGQPGTTIAPFGCRSELRLRSSLTAPTALQVSGRKLVGSLPRAAGLSAESLSVLLPC